MSAMPPKAQVNSERQWPRCGLRRLADFKLLTITDDGDERACLRMYNVNLCGGQGTTPIQFTSFSKREQADSFAQELSTALKLPAKDIVDTEPDADENY
jgi:hypothetical protein